MTPKVTAAKVLLPFAPCAASTLRTGQPKVGRQRKCVRRDVP